MFRKSRRKIIASIMGVLVLLFLGTLAIIYGSSYYEVYSQNHAMLENYANIYLVDVTESEELPSNTPSTDNGTEPAEPPAGAPSSDNSTENAPPEMPANPGPNGPGPRTQEERREAAYQLSTFYSVAISDEGEILRVDNEEGTGGYSDDELTTLAQALLAGGKTSGIQWNLVYLVSNKEDYTLVAFMDNTIMQESMTTLFRYTFIYGAVALLLFFLLSIHLARRIVEPLEESYTRQRQFISDAGHELKTPVAVITANTEILEKKLGKNQWISNIQYETERMGSLVSQLLELARTENVQVETEVLDYSHLVCGEVLPFESVAFENGVALDYDIADDIHVNGNRTQLRQLTSILVDNAIRHCSVTGSVHLSLTANRSQALLTVSNTGEAIPEEQRERIFERFYRADESRTDNGHHYGLGLAIAKAIVTAHHGRIAVSCQDGQVTFTARLPLAK